MKREGSRGVSVLTIDLGERSTAQGRVGRFVASLALMPARRERILAIRVGVYPFVQCVGHLTINEWAMFGARKQRVGEGSKPFGDGS